MMNPLNVDDPGIRSRARIAVGLLAVLFAVLSMGFLRIQVLESGSYRLRSDDNRLRPFPVEAPRGKLLDREGRIIAGNLPSYSAHVFPSASPELMEDRLEALAPYLGLDDARVADLAEQAHSNPFQPLEVDRDATFDEVSLLEERRPELPGVIIETHPKRYYRGAHAVSHVVGYVGEITVEELEQDRYAGYPEGVTVGKQGIELQYDRELQGRRGLRYTEVDAFGRVIGFPLGRVEQSPLPGLDLQLNLDLDLMEWIHHIFPEDMKGALVVLDTDGGVLALYSAPTFDPNRFADGLSAGEWAALARDPARPLFNRAVAGRYAPGSTWKPAVGALALALGLTEPHDFMPQACTGAMRYGNRIFRCWNPEGHGWLDLAGALEKSCNIYFYQLGLKVGLERLVEGGNGMGFARRCGIDLPEESPGIFPSGPAFWEERFGYRPQAAEVLSLSIGQGPVDQTPLGIAHFYLALARGGKAPAPRILRGGEPADLWDTGITPEHAEIVLEGLKQVVSPGGTAYLSSLEHWDLMGKSGTTQNAHDPNRNHAWFAGIAGPRNSNPEVVVVALVEFGESGSVMAAPLVAKSADYFLRKRYGIPTDTIQTLWEHYLTGTPAPWAIR